MADLLQSIAATDEQDPVEFRRLTAAGVHMNFAKMGRFLEQAYDCFKKLPDSDQREYTEQIKVMRKAIAQVDAIAERLMESNK